MIDWYAVYKHRIAGTEDDRPLEDQIIDYMAQPLNEEEEE